MQLTEAEEAEIANLTRDHPRAPPTPRDKMEERQLKLFALDRAIGAVEHLAASDSFDDEGLANAPNGAQFMILVRDIYEFLK